MDSVDCDPSLTRNRLSVSELKQSLPFSTPQITDEVVDESDLNRWKLVTDEVVDVSDLNRWKLITQRFDIP